MPKSVYQVVFPYPPLTVYAAMTDLSRWQWRSDLKGLEVQEGGAAFTEIARGGGRTHFTITQQIPGVRYAFLMEHENFTGDWSGEFTAVSGGTRVTFTENLRMKRLPLRLLAPLFLPLKKMQKTYATDLMLFLSEHAQDYSAPFSCAHDRPSSAEKPRFSGEAAAFPPPACPADADAAPSAASASDSRIAAGSAPAHADPLSCREAPCQAADPACAPFKAQKESGNPCPGRALSSTLSLVFPAPEHADMVMEYRAEFAQNGETLHGGGGLKELPDYATWLRATQNNRSEQTVTPGLVPATTLLCLRKEDGKMVGIVQIRHCLNDYLLQFGGHIGYSVRKSERNKGYGKAMLSLALEECRNLGFKKVLLTCDKENTASARTIQSCGGVLENEVPEGSRITARYWISLE